MDTLQNVQLSFNNIWGTIPNTFYNLYALDSLHIRKTNTTGTIPTMQAPNLKDLVLSLNKLHGSLPSLSHLSSLTNLDVTYNALSGSIPHLPPSMTDIDLSYNKITGQIPSSMTYLTRLRTLLLHSNRLTGTLPSFQNCTSVNTFSVNRNSLIGTIDSYIWSLPQLILLGLGDNKFEGTLESVGSATNLQGLSIDNNKFDGSIPSDIGRYEYVQQYIFPL
jgi:Leucine-rich repeat (LRR) protein